MEELWLTRTRMLLQEDLQILQNASVAIVGIGGVGGAAAEALVRAGTGSLILMDHDRIAPSNLNRQLLATTQTIGKEKVLAAKERLLSIHPNLQLHLIPSFYETSTHPLLFDLAPDFVIDAIDTVSSKLDLLEQCNQRGIPSISCMGTGNRLNPTAFAVGRIEDTQGCGCGLAKVMRRELRKRRLETQMVVYSKEAPLHTTLSQDGRHIPGSISYCPPVAGYYLAYYAIQTLLQKAKNTQATAP